MSVTVSSRGSGDVFSAGLSVSSDEIYRVVIKVGGLGICDS